MSITLETLDLASPVLRELVEHGIRRRWISYEELTNAAQALAKKGYISADDFGRFGFNRWLV